VARHLISVENVTIAFGREPVLDRVALGISAGDRIGVVGRNGGGKSTLLALLSGDLTADSGRVTRTGGLHVGALGQRAPEAPGTVRDRVIGSREDHEWASEARVREVLDGLLGGYGPALLDRPLSQLSGGERRRVELARLMIEPLDVLLLDEPTNHLDVEAVAWLAGALRALRGTALVVVTHDRWFLDAVTDRTWEVVQGTVEEYDGGYSAYVLAKAERTRQADAAAERRANLLRKELAWLRRGAPARTSKPKFRIDAANALISEEPPPRDQVELTRFAGARLGRTVYELEDVVATRGDRRILDVVTWNIGPGDRVGILGPNGAGKTTLLEVILGRRAIDAGTRIVGATVKPAYLSQHLEDLDPTHRVLESVESIARRVDLGKGRELTASQLCERLGFDGSRQWTPVGDLSGGERRRLQLTRLLMAEPNVLVLDEPTNDFDVETLTALEDLLDGFAGTILVVSHDRYFLERVCTTFRRVMGDGSVVDLPGGVDDYLALRSAAIAGESTVAPKSSSTPAAASSTTALSAGDRRTLEKRAATLERQITKLQDQAAALHTSLADHATDVDRVRADTVALRDLQAVIDEVEEEWYAVIAQLE
jgi:ATP-binding cassette subfamily F protein uup